MGWSAGGVRHTARVVPLRTFNGTSDNVRTSVSPQANVGFGSIVAICRRNATTWNTILSLNTAAVATKLSLAILPSAQGNFLRLAGDDGSTASDSSFTVLPGDGIVLLAAAKATGTLAVDFWKYDYANRQLATSTGGAMPDAGLPGTTGKIHFAEWGAGSDLWDGDMASVALFDRKLTSSEVLDMRYSWDAWMISGNVGMWVYDQETITQLLRDGTGFGSDQTSISGTTVSQLRSPIGWRSRANYSELQKLKRAA